MLVLSLYVPAYVCVNVCQCPRRICILNANFVCNVLFIRRNTLLFVEHRQVLYYFERSLTSVFLLHTTNTEKHEIQKLACVLAAGVSTGALVWRCLHLGY